MRRLLVLGITAVVVGGCAGEGGEPAPPPNRFFSTQQTLAPRAHLFGDPVQARIDVVVDREQLDPDRLRVRLDFRPYRMIDGLHRSREDFSRSTRVRFEATLRCLTVECIPQRLGSILGDQEGRGERRTFRFKAIRFVYDDPETGRTRAIGRALFPALDSISRLTPTEGPDFRFRPPGAEFEATLAPVLEPEYAAPPGLVAALLLLAAAGLLVLPGRYVVRWLRDRRAVVAERSEPTPLERALLRVERARDHGDANEQREALEALASELDGGGNGDVRAVRRLAWSAAPPAEEDLTGVVSRLRGADGARV